MTSAHEIEGYTFHVKNQEIISEEKNDYLLLYLRRNEDNENIVLRIPQFYDDSSNEITQSFIRLKLDYDLNYNITTEELKEWFIELLNILKNNQCARVIGNNRKQLDVTKIAHTYSYASFFDVFNSKHLFDINIKPICIKEKPNKTISKFYGYNGYV